MISLFLFAPPSPSTKPSALTLLASISCWYDMISVDAWSVGGNEELLHNSPESRALFPRGGDSLDESAFALGVIFLPNLFDDSFFYSFLHTQLSTTNKVLFVYIFLPLTRLLLPPRTHHQHHLLFRWRAHRRVRIWFYQLLLLFLRLMGVC